MNAATKTAHLNYDHLNAVLDDARERWLEKERESAHERLLVLVKDSSKEQAENS